MHIFDLMANENAKRRDYFAVFRYIFAQNSITNCLERHEEINSRRYVQQFCTENPCKNDTLSHQTTNHDEPPNLWIGSVYYFVLTKVDFNPKIFLNFVKHQIFEEGHKVFFAC